MQSKNYMVLDGEAARNLDTKCIANGVLLLAMLLDGFWPGRICTNGHGGNCIVMEFLMDVLV
jgi:hypothetical protein